MRRTLLVLFFFISILLASEGYKRKRAAILDDLDDAVDDEDDDAWEQWGLKKGGSRLDKNLPPPDFSKMDPSKIQELMEQYTGPSYGFVKLRFGVSHSKEDVQNIATKWSKMLKTGSIDVRHGSRSEDIHVYHGEGSGFGRVEGVYLEPERCI